MTQQAAREQQQATSSHSKSEETAAPEVSGRSPLLHDPLLKKHLPFKSHFIEISGHRMHYLDEGQGPVVILLHGNPTWCFYFRGLVAVLRHNFRVIVPDYLGCGLSDHPTEAHFRANDRVNHLVELATKLGLTKYSLVMHDWGGAIGTDFALRNIAAIEKIVYLNTTLTETESLPSIIKLAATPLIGKFLTKTTRYFVRLTTRLGVSKKISSEIRHCYHLPYRTAARRTAIWDFVADIPFSSDHPSYANMLNLAEGLPNLKDVPVQIVWGLRDPCFHREMLNKVADHFPQARVLEIAEASHLVLEDAPQLANSTILAFLREDPMVSRREVLRRRDRKKLQSQGPRGLYEAFLDRVEEIPGGDAVIAPEWLGETVRYGVMTYASFAALVNKYQRGLAELGLHAGDRVLMLVTPGADFLALSYAVIGRGAVPVFVDPGVGTKQLCETIKSIDADVFIGSPRAQLLRWFKRKLFANVRFHLTVSNFAMMGGPNLSYLKRFASRAMDPVDQGPVQMIAYTSGATGAPKGVIYTPQMVDAQLSILQEQFGIGIGTRDLPLLPIFSLFNLALGVCSAFPPINPSKPLALAPDRIIKMIGDLRITSSFGSPTLWNKIAEYCIRCRLKLPSVKKVFIAGAPVAASVLGRVQSVLSEGEVFTPYGATEALPVTFVSAQEIAQSDLVTAVGGEQGTLVGFPVQGVELRVIESVAGPIASIDQAVGCGPKKIGEIIVRGKNISQNYFKRPDADLAGKISDRDLSWHRMGDVGYLDASGKLYFCGRKAHAVQGKDRIYYSIPVERIFNQHPNVRRSALVAVESGAGAAIVIEPQPHAWPEDAATRERFTQELLTLARANQLTAAISEIYFHPSFPVDARHNAKIYRDRLGAWVAEEKKRGQK